MKQIMIVLLAAAVLFSMMPMSEGFSALAEEKDPFHFATFGEARNAAMRTVGEENARDCISGEEGYCVALIKCYSAHYMRRKPTEIVKFRATRSSWRKTKNTSKSMRLFYEQTFSLTA